MGTESIELSTPDGDMPAYVATPDGDVAGGVLVVQEAFGITSHIESICRRLADAGYVAVAPAYFHRSRWLAGVRATATWNRSVR